ncbi:MAG: right-handed parallel beta-helix repeat-containing protein [Candidatus Heimdallarchaeaceae archaeon]
MKQNDITLLFIFIILTFAVISSYTQSVVMKPQNPMFLTNFRHETISKPSDHAFNFLFDPIVINSDDDFINYKFPGNGTIDDPYRISNLTILTNESIGIFISQTTAYFVISDCHITALNYGIYLSNVHSNTALIINNTIEYNSEAAIYLSSSLGIKIKDNSLFQNGCGILTLLGSNSQIVNNTISNNTSNGIRLINSDSCLIIYNNISLNKEYGIYIAGNCQYNSVHHNWFIENSKTTTSQGYDDGIDNLWFFPQTKEGNYWNNWDGVGGYLIDGNAKSVDYYPLDITGNRYSTSQTVETTQQVLSEGILLITVYILSISYIFQHLKKHLHIKCN